MLGREVENAVKRLINEKNPEAALNFLKSGGSTPLVMALQYCVVRDGELKLKDPGDVPGKHPLLLSVNLNFEDLGASIWKLTSDALQADDWKRSNQPCNGVKHYNGGMQQSTSERALYGERSGVFATELFEKFVLPVAVRIGDPASSGQNSWVLAQAKAMAQLGPGDVPAATPAAAAHAAAAPAAAAAAPAGPPVAPPAAQGPGVAHFDRNGTLYPEEAESLGEITAALGLEDTFGRIDNDDDDMHRGRRNNARLVASIATQSRGYDFLRHAFYGKNPAVHFECGSFSFLLVCCEDNRSIAHAFGSGSGRRIVFAIDLYMGEYLTHEAKQELLRSAILETFDVEPEEAVCECCRKICSECLLLSLSP